MKKLLVVPLLILVVLLVGCKAYFVAEESSQPQRSESVVVVEDTPKLRDFTITAHLDGEYIQLPEALHLSETRNADVNLVFYNYYQHFGNVYLYLITDYVEEPINCKVTEYYDGRFNEVIDLDLKRYWYDDEAIANYGDQLYYFESDRKPKQVKYALECTGLESGNVARSTVTANLAYS